MMVYKTILVHSFKGGTGKTLTSINLADYLVKNGNNDTRVLIIEADFTMSGFHSIFKDYKPDIFLNDYLNSSDTSFDRYIYPDKNADMGLIFCNVDFRANDKIHGSDQNWFLQKKTQLAKTIDDTDYDYIIFDCQPGTHLFTINLITLSNEIILLLRPDVQSLRGTMVLLEKIYSRSIPKSNSNKRNFSLLFNQTPRIPEIKDLISDWKNKFKYQFNFIDKILTLPYEDITSYRTAIEQFVLPDDDPTKQKIGELFSYLR